MPAVTLAGSYLTYRHHLTGRHARLKSSSASVLMRWTSLIPIVQCWPEETGSASVHIPRWQCAYVARQLTGLTDVTQSSLHVTGCRSASAGYAFRSRVSQLVALLQSKRCRRAPCTTARSCCPRCAYQSRKAAQADSDAGEVLLQICEIHPVVSPIICGFHAHVESGHGNVRRANYRLRRRLL